MSEFKDGDCVYNVHDKSICWVRHGGAWLTDAWGVADQTDVTIKHMLKDGDVTMHKAEEKNSQFNDGDYVGDGQGNVWERKNGAWLADETGADRFDDASVKILIDAGLLTHYVGLEERPAGFDDGVRVSDVQHFIWERQNGVWKCVNADLKDMEDGFVAYGIKWDVLKIEKSEEKNSQFNNGDWVTNTSGGVWYRVDGYWHSQGAEADSFNDAEAKTFIEANILTHHARPEKFSDGDVVEDAFAFQWERQNDVWKCRNGDEPDFTDAEVVNHIDNTTLYLVSGTQEDDVSDVEAEKVTYYLTTKNGAQVAVHEGDVVDVRSGWSNASPSLALVEDWGLWRSAYDYSRWDDLENYFLVNVYRPADMDKAAKFDPEYGSTITRPDDGATYVKTAEGWFLVNGGDAASVATEIDKEQAENLWKNHGWKLTRNAI